MMDFSVTESKHNGFEGFVSIADLKRDECECVLKQMGVYAVLRLKSTQPEFRLVSTGGWSKGKNPTVDEGVLRSNWVDEAIVMYVGKAGGKSSRAHLRKRLKEYMNFGCGRAIGHWGGRLIWQLEDSEELVVAWKWLVEEEPKQVESTLIANFVSQYRKMPFANLI